MKQGDYLFVFLVILFLFPFVNANTITANTITGDASSQQIGVSLTVLLSAPIISIDFPENKTYIVNVSFPFNYTSVYEDYIWYVLDGGPNVTLTGDTFVNVSDGGHNLSLYANNSLGTVYENVIFTIDLDLLTIYYDEYYGSESGDSTNFNYTAYEDLQNLSDMVLENTSTGKILFLETINVTDDSNFSDLTVDLDQYVQIDYNQVEIDTTNLPNLNKSALITLYNITFDDPRILRDGSVCPPSVCTIVSFVNNTLVFNVTDFSGVYSSEEDVAVVTPPSGPGGGDEELESDFEVDVASLLASLRQGDSESKTVVITNTGETTEIISIDISNEIDDYIIISPNTLEILPGESKEVEVIFSADLEDIPGLYSGKIYFENELGDVIEIPTFVEIESEEALLDLSLDIVKDPAIFVPSEQVTAKIKLFNIGEGEAEVELIYTFVNENGEVVFEDTEIAKVKNFEEITRVVLLADDFEVGDYIFRVTSNYQGKTASASDFFTVAVEGYFDFFKEIRRIIEEGARERSIAEWGIIILLIILGIFFFFLLWKRRKKKEEKKVGKRIVKKKRKKRSKPKAILLQVRK